MCIFVCFIFLILATANGSSNENLQPSFFIYPEKSEDFIDANQDFTVVCYSTKHIAWSTPHSRYESESEFSYVHTNEELSGKPEYNYKSTLRLINASFSDTGYYYCHENAPDQDLNDPNNFASVYLYVGDDNHLSARTNDLDTVTAVQYLDAVIPCRPTSPDVDVQIYRFSGEMEKIKIQLNQPDETGAVFTYDPHKGFITNKTMEIIQTVFQCTFRRRDKEENYTYILDIEQMTDSIAKPVIEDLNSNHTVAGETLKISCQVKSSVGVDMNFTIPGEWDNRVQKSSLKRVNSDEMYTMDLTIVNVTPGDKGVYTCRVKNMMHNSSNSVFVNVYDKNEHFIKLFEENDHLTIHETAGQDSVQWVIRIDAHPKPDLEWINNLNQTIKPEDSRYDIEVADTFMVLKIRNISLFDRGYYTLQARNDFGEVESLQVFLNITDKPEVNMESSRFNLINNPSSLTCTAYAYPEATIRWFFKPCEDDSCEYNEELEASSATDGIKVVSHLVLHPTTIQNGFVKCFARNELGEDAAEVEYYVSDVLNGFDVWGLEGLSSDETGELREVTVATNETVEIYCGAALRYSDSVIWFGYNSDSEVFTENITSDYSYQSKLVINGITASDEGTIACMAENLHSQANPLKFINVTIRVSDPWLEIVNFTDFDEDDELFLNRDLTLRCIAHGLPKPNVVWFKDGKEVWNHDNIRLENDGQVLQIFRATVNNKGSYHCEASNRAHADSRMLKIQFKDEPGRNYTAWITVSVLVVLLILALMGYCLKTSKEKKLKQALRLAGLEHFDKGALENLNPDLTVDDQAELLPYDKKWEFPRDKLKLGKQLGAGAFGVVVKADAFGISEGEEKTTVAVKMVKRNADHTYIKALASELKIMIHMGQHVNVVNLLGACTKNVVKRELLVIVEYCRYGNLHNYLLRHREDFINQIDPVTKKIDYNIGYEELERTFSMSSDGSNRSGRGVSMTDYRANSSYSGRNVNTENTEVCMTPSPDSKTEEGMVISNNSIQPEWRSNYRGDYRGKVKPICTKDLLTWAFQVARGMEYLASRRVLHGDLAARNILLADNNVVKICDFGLAKSMYNSNDYKKKGDGPLPVKWMAVESIRDRVFSTQSDVWSYGIVLWEFFSLARTPYPGMEANERLYQKLVEGYRMDSPEYATKEVYAVMKDCWNAKPLARPTFTSLVQRIGLMLEDSVRKHYIDLNDPYLLMNTQRLQDGHSDYLAMLSPPDFETISSPHSYVNDAPDSIPDQPSGYLLMKPANIFSPRDLNDENVFVFDQVKTGSDVEIIPMLEGDEGVKSYANPSYHVLLKAAKDHVDICKTKDNYVNMPQNKSAIKNERHYVNGGVDVSNNEQTCL